MAWIWYCVHEERLGFLARVFKKRQNKCEARCKKPFLTKEEATKGGTAHVNAMGHGVAVREVARKK